MKKIIAGLLATIAVFGAVPNGSFIFPEQSAFTASATTNGTYGSMTYTMYDEHVEITGFDNSVSELEIPSEIEGVPVTIIADSAFENATKLETVILPNCITEIEEYAFYNCTLLQSINLPNNLNSIGYRAFKRCISLSEIKLPNSLTSMASSVFSECVSLQEISFPNSLSVIPDDVCYYCTSLRTVYIDNGPNEIETGAFNGCDSLKTVYIPISIQSVSYGGDTSFARCSSLSDVYYGGSQSQWKVIDGINQFSNSTIHYEAKELPEPLTPDVNRDGVIDASDASLILAYYAYVQTGGTGTIEDYLNS